MEAEFRSTRSVTYRAYKYNFAGNPTEPPVLKAFAYGLNAETSTIVYYASWNGATEVSTWKFHRERNNRLALIGSVKRTGFETRFQSQGYVNQKVYVEATDIYGSVLGRSLSVDIQVLIDWDNDRPLDSKGHTYGKRSNELCKFGTMTLSLDF